MDQLSSPTFSAIRLVRNTIGLCAVLSLVVLGVTLVLTIKARNVGSDLLLCQVFSFCLLVAVYVSCYKIAAVAATQLDGPRAYRIPSIIVASATASHLLLVLSQTLR